MLELKEIMLEFAFFFFTLAIIAALLGFLGLVGLAALAAKAICVAFLILFIIATFRRHPHRSIISRNRSHSGKH